MRKRIAICGLLGLGLPGSLAFAQEAPAPPPAAQQGSAGSNYVTRDEYDKLQNKLDAVIKQMGDMKQERTVSQAEVDKTIDDIEKDLKNNHRLINDMSLGTNKLFVGGDGSFGFQSQRKANSTFSASFAPLLVFELDKNILFEGALDISGATAADNTSSTTTNLSLANLTFLISDNLYAGGGLFTVPFGRYHTSYDPSWINKLPDDPLVFGDRAIAPGAETGLFAGGSMPVSGTMVEYNAYVSNGPNINLTDPASAGSLNFDDYTDLNNGKAVGGRIGFLPVSQVDVGYSVQYSNPVPSHVTFDKDIHALLQAVDAQYKSDIQAIKGTVEARVEWVWANVDSATYDPTGALGYGPLNFNNDRNGGYAQLSYRPSLVDSKVIKNFEFVVRYDTIRVSKGAPGGGDESRWAFGIDYWVTPSVVLKTAYEIDDKNTGSGQNTFFVQCGFGL